MIAWLKKLFTKYNEVIEDPRILYYRKRLLKEMEERQNKEKVIFEKLYKYRDKLVENGLYDLDD